MSDNSAEEIFTTGNDEKLPEIDAYKIKKAAITIRGLTNEIRKRIITAIQENPKITVTELYVKLKLKQSILSQHLAILRRIGILTQRRQGKYVYYSINTFRMIEINRLVENLVK
jgi:DNA-binding transcriptional ArsR family regulator